MWLGFCHKVVKSKSSSFLYLCLYRHAIVCFVAYYILPLPSPAFATITTSYNLFHLLQSLFLFRVFKLLSSFSLIFHFISFLTTISDLLDLTRPSSLLDCHFLQCPLFITIVNTKLRSLFVSFLFFNHFLVNRMFMIYELFVFCASIG